MLLAGAGLMHFAGILFARYNVVGILAAPQSARRRPLCRTARSWSRRWRKESPLRILLIEPSKAPVAIGGEDLFLYEPLALEYVAAGVAADHEVRLLDLRLERNLPGTLEEFQPEVVGITGYTVHVNVVRALFDQVKRWNPRALTVVGGHHATVAPEDFLSPAIALIVLGEGVFAFREVVARFAHGEGFDGIPGVAFARAGQLVKAEARPVHDLDAFPWPQRSLTARYRQHYFAEWMKPLATIRTSKECPHRCSFCALWRLTGGRYIKRDLDKIVEELAGLDEECIFFADDESLIDASRMKTLAARIKEAGLRKRFFLYGRSDTIARNPALLEAWREVGLERVFVGLEFCRDEDLQYIGKGSTTRDNARAVRVLQDLRIEVYASLIVRPEFDRADFAALAQYCRDLELNFAGFAVLTPLPGTDFYEQVHIHTVLPTRLPLEEFYQQYFHLYTRAISLTKRFALARKFRLRDFPSALRRQDRFLKRVATIHRDYEMIAS